jgi:hypothetical protein
MAVGREGELAHERQQVVPGDHAADSTCRAGAIEQPAGERVQRRGQFLGAGQDTLRRRTHDGERGVGQLRLQRDVEEVGQSIPGVFLGQRPFRAGDQHLQARRRHGLHQGFRHHDQSRDRDEHGQDGPS